ncbi:PIKK family atypical protein kinase [Trichomonas vaginalis G3]|uniref:PIKK family atypical protein kinase n=1 Tax=Trichomonas vaginalis (strain ATCC PRA-98 / G3) TaxID=412133 RepID=A2D8Y6_TRIV3|nr:protein serine/threonine kinase protein [Trichomonas vaginalis G3]EAY23012.1 PIKK family atypical protein kinase [Trichomonas vaginalis G3]KAI5518971.1 protein serine/threonine kinase protein [Trichomonas vaginalis G3]|eukprot:XP_001583998.1 PIKK family atypical protein kinase [Trichomonas vaginalis G3]
MFIANADDPVGQAVCALIEKAVPSNQSLKEEEFDYYVEDLQDQIITHFNYHRIQEVPEFIDSMLSTTMSGAKTDDKKRRYAAAVCLATLISLFPFDDLIPQFEPIIMQLLRPGFKRLVVVGAKVVGYLGGLTGQNRNHLIKILAEKNAALLSAPNQRPENLFTAAIILKEVATAAPEHIFVLTSQYFIKMIYCGLYSHDSNVRDICVDIVETLFTSQAASVGVFFLTDILEKMRYQSVERLSREKNDDDLISCFKLLQILLRQRPYIDPDLTARYLIPTCSRLVTSPNFEIMNYAIVTIMFLHESEIYVTDPYVIQTIMKQLFDVTLKYGKMIEPLFTKVIHTYPEYVRKELQQLIDWFGVFMTTLPKNASFILVFQLVVASIDVVTDQKQLSHLLELVNQLMSNSSMPTPIHMLLQSLNQHHPNWDRELHNYKKFLVRLIHEEMGGPYQRWEVTVISLNAIDQLNDLSYPDAVVLHSLVMALINSPDWQVRERVASSALHLFKNHIDKMPLETMMKLVDLAVYDSVRSVRKKSLFAFKPNVYKYLAQPEIIWKFSRLIYDESFGVRKHAIEILGALVPRTSASILRELLLTTLRQLPNKYNPIIPPHISDIFPELISASEPIIYLYADAIFQRFLKMLNERFSQTTFKDPSLVYMNSAQLRDIDGSLIKSLSHLNELCPDIVLSGPVINVLSKVLALPVHPWTKAHALKALRCIAQGEYDISFVWRDHFNLIESVIKIIRENASLKLVTLSLKLLGSISACSMPTMLNPSSRKNIFIFRSFFSGLNEFKNFFIKRYFTELLDILSEPMIDTKRETIAGVLTQLFVADPDSVANYLTPFFNVFLPMFPNTSISTLRKFFDYLTVIVKLAGRMISPHATSVFVAIENHWQQQLTVEGSHVISALIEATHGQCDSILHLVVPICFQLIRFKKQGHSELFRLLRAAADYTPSYLKTIIEGIAELAQSPETQDNVLDLCVKTLSFIVDQCDCSEHLATIKRCAMKVKANSAKYRERAINIVEAIDGRVEQDDDTTEVDDDFEKRPTPPVVDSVVAADIATWMQLPEELNDDSLAKWYRELETRLINIAPSPVVRALVPLNDFPGLLPSFSFTFAFLTTWQNLSRPQKGEITVLLNQIFKCESIPTWIAKQFTNLAEFSVLSEIDIRLDFAALIPFCENHQFYAKALFFLDYAPSTFPFTKLIHLNSICGRKLEARALAKRYSQDIDHNLWMELGEWDNAIACINKSLDPSRFIYPQVICKAATEDWDGILKLRDSFYDLPLHDKVDLAKYFMMAAVYMGEDETAEEFFQMSNGFTTDDQIMRAQMLIRNNKLDAALQAIRTGWRYLASSVSAIEKCNKNLLQDYSLQAQQLLELGEVIDCLKDPSEIENINNVWLGRLHLIQNSPDRQKELYKIRSLVPNLPHFDALMLDTISYYIWLGQRDVAIRLVDVFFPDENSPHAQYVQLELSGREEKINEMLELATTCNNQELSSRLLQLIGNIRMKSASKLDDFKKVSEHYLNANKSYEKIGNIFIIIAHAGGGIDAAKTGVVALGKSIKMKPVKQNLFANQLFGALVNFGQEKQVADAVAEAMNELSPQSLATIYSTAFHLLLNPSENIRDVAAQICFKLVSSHPQYVGFQLLMMESKHWDIDALEQMYDKMQMEYPVIFSHVSLIYKELLKMSNILYIVYQTSIEEANQLFKAGDNKGALDKLMAFLKLLNDPNKTVHDTQFFSGYATQLQKVLQEIQNKGKIEEEDFATLYNIRKSLQKRFQSLRVIRLSSISPRLEQQTNWELKLLGSHSLQKNGVKIGKFSHSVGNHEHGMHLTLIGTDGKRYNYQLRRNLKKVRSLATEQLVDALTPILDDIHHINHGSIIQLSGNLYLFEVPKGQASMYEMITVYEQSKGRIIDAEQASIKKWYNVDYSQLSVEDRVNALKNVRKYFEGNELSRAILVTSKDADAWAYRTSHFSSSLGAMSALAFMLGSVDHSPQQFLIDKITGNVTFSSFAGGSRKQSVPFRLTPQLSNALGRCQYSGPFSSYFTQTMKDIRKRAISLAPVLQFFIADPPFTKPKIPHSFMKQLGVEIPVEENQTQEEKEIDEEINDIYARLVGTDVSLETELQQLIESATDINNIAKMPPSWYPWW